MALGFRCLTASGGGGGSGRGGLAGVHACVSDHERVRARQRRPATVTGDAGCTSSGARAEATGPPSHGPPGAFLNCFLRDPGPASGEADAHGGRGLRSLRKPRPSWFWRRAQKTVACEPSRAPRHGGHVGAGQRVCDIPPELLMSYSFGQLSNQDAGKGRAGSLGIYT